MTTLLLLVISVSPAFRASGIINNVNAIQFPVPVGTCGATSIYGFLHPLLAQNR